MVHLEAFIFKRFPDEGWQDLILVYSAAANFMLPLEACAIEHCWWLLLFLYLLG